MSKSRTTVRTEVVIDGESLLLAPREDVEDLKRRFEAAAATSGTFVDLVTAGDRVVSALVTPHTRVTISVSPVEMDPRAGDDDEPFGSLEFLPDLG